MHEAFSFANDPLFLYFALLYLTLIAARRSIEYFCGLLALLLTEIFHRPDKGRRVKKRKPILVCWNITIAIITMRLWSVRYTMFIGICCLLWLLYTVLQKRKEKRILKTGTTSVFGGSLLTKSKIGKLL